MKKLALPKTVEYRGSTATIYLQNPRNKTRYEVRYYDVDGAQQRLTFATFEAAKEFAEAAVREISQNRSNFITLRGQEAYGYQQAVTLLSTTGVSLIDAARLVFDNVKLVGSAAQVAEALKYFVDNRPTKPLDVSVRQVVNEFVNLKIQEGEVGDLHLRDLRNRLGRFADAFECPISKVRPEAIRDHVLKQDVGLRTRHNLRTTLTTFLNYARAEGYIPADHRGVLFPAKRKKTKLNVQVFSPDELGRILKAADVDEAVPVALTAFAGIRAEEVKLLDCCHVDFNERHIVIPNEIDKNEARRIVPLPENLAAWLQHLHGKTGPISQYTNLANLYGRLAERSGVQWKRNALRHGFISYRIALIKNIPQVAYEAGNSPEMIQRHYLKVVTEAAAKQWFAVLPKQASNVVPMPVADVQEQPAAVQL
ncbi:MAG: tyrosine-type recombinase/integrase [Verrucomicrobia bacterium]|nr:tyrosine-type recombinase/integrase [Verrucomicrobiota bacterium]